MLSARPSYSGAVRIEMQGSGGEAVMEGELSFDRREGWVHFKRADGAELTIDLQSNEMSLLKGGVKGAPEDKDFPAFALLHNAAIAEPDSRTEVEIRVDGYTVRNGDQSMILTYIEAPGESPDSKD